MIRLRTVLAVVAAAVVGYLGAPLLVGPPAAPARPAPAVSPIDAAYAASGCEPADRPGLDFVLVRRVTGLIEVLPDRLPADAYQPGDAIYGWCP